jgi:hypothetical protein
MLERQTPGPPPFPAPFHTIQPAKHKFFSRRLSGILPDSPLLSVSGGGLSLVKFADPTAASTSDKNSAHVLVCSRFRGRHMAKGGGKKTGKQNRNMGGLITDCSRRCICIWLFIR